jgi:hypothetical protein
MDKDICSGADDAQEPSTAVSNPSSDGHRPTAEATNSGQEEKVGPGHPPKEYKWPKGRSGNYKGRPPKPRVLVDLRRMFEKVLAKKVTLTQGEKRTILQTGLEQWGIQFAKGDRYARQDFFYYAKELGIDLMASHRKEVEEALTADHQAILDAYVQRRSQATAPRKSPPVLAPAELLDDDVGDPEKAQ